MAGCPSPSSQACQYELKDVCKWSQVISWRYDTYVHFNLGVVLLSLLDEHELTAAQADSSPIEATDSQHMVCTM